MSSPKIPTIAEKIKQQIRDMPKEEVVELGLDNCDGSTLDGLTDEFKSVEIISLINSQVTNLEKFPSLPKLQVVNLTSNNITTGLESLSKCPELVIISISDNPIADVSELAPLKDLEKLSKLVVTDCEFTKTPGYDKKIFDLLPNLTFLDEVDRDGNPDEIMYNFDTEDGECDEIDLGDLLKVHERPCTSDEDGDKCCGDDKSPGSKRKCHDNDKKEEVKKRRNN